MLDQLNKLRVADRALQLAKDARIFSAVETLARKTQEGTLGEPDNHQAEPMGVSVGNTNYYGQPPGKLSGLLKTAAVMVALGVGSVGVFAAGWMFALSALARPAQPPAPQEREFEVRFYDAQGRPIQVPRLPEDQSGSPNKPR